MQPILELGIAIKFTKTTLFFIKLIKIFDYLDTL